MVNKFKRRYSALSVIREIQIQMATLKYHYISTRMAIILKKDQRGYRTTREFSYNAGEDVKGYCSCRRNLPVSYTVKHGSHTTEQSYSYLINPER